VGDIDPQAQPPSLRQPGAALLFQLIAAAYKQIDAPVGALGLATLAASTKALAGDDATYARIEAALGKLTTLRDTVAGQIIAELEAAEFGGQALQTATASLLAAQAAHAMASGQSLARWRDRAPRAAGGGDSDPLSWDGTGMSLPWRRGGRTDRQVRANGRHVGASWRSSTATPPPIVGTGRQVRDDWRWMFRCRRHIRRARGPDTPPCRQSCRLWRGISRARRQERRSRAAAQPSRCPESPLRRLGRPPRALAWSPGTATLGFPRHVLLHPKHIVRARWVGDAVRDVSKPVEAASPTKAWTAAAVVVVALGLAARLSIILRPVPVLESRYLADDFFYYLNIARHIAAGRGSSFDGGVTATNGYNPLYVWLLSLAFWLGAGKAAAIRVGLLIQAVSAAIAGWLAFRSCRRREAPRAGLLAAGVLSCSPFFVWPTLSGFELGLSLLATFVALELWDRAGTPAWLLGIACGVAFYARADGLAVPVVFLLTLAKRRRWTEAAILTSAFAITVAPFCVWSAVRFGVVLPGSAVEKTHVRSLASISASLQTFASTLPSILVSNRILDRAPRLVVVVLSGVVGLLCLRGARRLGAQRALLCAAIIGAYTTITDGFEPGALKRYLFPAWALLLMSAALELDRGRWTRARPVQSFVRFEPAAHTFAIALIVWAALSDCLLLVRWDRVAKPASSYVAVSSAIAPELATYVSDGARVASFDSGALGYFSTVPVINLDGLVNQDIPRVRRACGPESYESCLLRYMHDKHATVFVGSTAFGWPAIFPDWRAWTRLHESSPLADGSSIVVLRVPAFDGAGVR